VAVALGVGAAMPDEFIGARLECIDDAGRIVEDRRVDEMGPAGRLSSSKSSRQRQTPTLLP